MMVLSSIVPPQWLEKWRLPSEPVPDPNDTAHIDRCTLLLRTRNGINLVRELLIFVAAWELREDELYFKFMHNMIAAILENGLLKLAYHAFKE
jgi:palmitoyltransferase